MPEWLKEVFGGLGSVGSYLLNHFTGLSRSEKEQNQFNAAQAQQNRDFQAQQQTQQNAFNVQQAQVARDWTASREDTQYQRTVADMRAAGINPALAVNNGPIGASAAQPASAGSAPSGSAASGHGGGRASLSEILQAANFAKQLKLADAQIANVKSDTALNDAQSGYVKEQATGQNLSNRDATIRLQYLQPLTQAQLDSLRSSLENDKVRRALDQSGIELNQAQSLLTGYNAIAASIDNETRSELNKLEARLRVAQIANTAQSTKESRQRVRTLEAQASELYQRCALHAANERLIDEQARNTLVQTGLLKYDEKRKEFEVDHLKADRNWRNVQSVFGMLRDAGSAVGSVAGGFAGFAPRVVSTYSYRR